MKWNCKIIEDLLPLYADAVCSDESKQLVEEHLKSCEACRKLLDRTQLATTPYIETETGATDRVIKKGLQKIRIRWLLSVIFAVVIISSLFVGGYLYRHGQLTSRKEYKIGYAFMEQLSAGNYEKAFSYIHTDRMKQQWLEYWFTEGELADFDVRVRDAFLQYAENIAALGGIEQYELMDVVFLGSLDDGVPVYSLMFRIRFNGEARGLEIRASENGVEALCADGSFISDPLAQFCAWSEYLWQEYQGCYFDPISKEYVYT